MTHRKFIVEGEQLLSTIKSALEDNIQNRTIIIELMASIENNIWTVLEDDCEVVEDGTE
jgi:hypothetical protein